MNYYIYRDNFIKKSIPEIKHYIAVICYKVAPVTRFTITCTSYHDQKYCA